MGEKALDCPSAPCATGARILGIVDASGQVRFSSTALPATGAFVEGALQDGEPTTRFRFSAPCQGNHCSKWNGTGCGVAELVQSFQVPHSQKEAMSGARHACPIRLSCRWRHEHGPSICSSCEWIVTNRPPVAVSKEGTSGELSKRSL